MIKIVNEELTSLMGGASAGITFSPRPPTVILMAGLQGSGKTTATAKLAKLLKEQNNSSVAVAACEACCRSTSTPPSSRIPTDDDLDGRHRRGDRRYLLKLAGLSLPPRVLEHPVVERVADLIPVALLAALVAVQVLASEQSLVVDARLAGLAAAFVLLLVRAPFLVVVFGAALVAALIRLWS